MVTINLNARKKSYDDETGEISDVTITFSRNTFVSNPHQVSEIVVDKHNYLTGDMNIDVAYLSLKEMFEPFVEDTELITSYRKFNGRSGGLDTATDTIVFCDISYRIVSITPLLFFAGTPTKYRLQLRAL